MTKQVINSFVFLLVCLLTGCGSADKKSSPNSKESAAEARKASAAIQNNKWDKGIEHCDKALKLDPENIEALWMRGLAYLKKEDFDKAIADCSEALRLDDKKAPALRERGYAYIGKKNYPKAIADFTAYIALRPKDAEGFEARAIAYKLDGKNDLADADKKTAKTLRNQPKDG